MAYLVIREGLEKGGENVSQHCVPQAGVIKGDDWAKPGCDGLMRT